MRDLGDRPLRGVINFCFYTTGLDSAPETLSGTPAVSVIKDDSTTESTAGVTLTVDFDALTGLNHVVIDTDDAFYSAGSDYTVVITSGTVDGISVVGAVLATFSVENRMDSAISKSGFLVRDALIQSVTNQTEFVLASGPTIDLPADSLAIVFDADNGNPSAVTVTSYTGSTKTLILDSAPGFTVAPNDTVTLLATAELDTVANVTTVGTVTNPVVTDTASREASKADVSALATQAELDKVPKKGTAQTWTNQAGDTQTVTVTQA